MRGLSTARRPATGEAGAPGAIDGLRRSLLAGGAASAAVGLGGCAWFGSGRPRPPELAPLTGPNRLRTVWTASVGRGGLGFAPFPTGNGLWAAAADGTLVRVDPASGRVAVRASAGKRLVTGVGSDGIVAVVGARDGSLMAFDAEGVQRWSTPVGAEVVSVPAVGLGLAIIRTSDARIAAYDAETGRRRWIVSRPNPPLVLRQTASIAIAPGTAYVGLPGGRLVALGLDTGAVRWEGAVSQPRGSNEIERIADVVGSPLVSGREVCAGTFQGRVTCFDATTGRALWSRDLAVTGGIELDPRMIVAVDDRGQIHAFSRSGGSLWRQDRLAGREPSAALSLGGAVIVGDGLGTVHAFARDDGAPIGRATTDGSAIVSAPVAVPLPSAAGSALAVVQTTAGALHAYAVDP